MASILDLLKAKGIDTSGLTGDQDDSYDTSPDASIEVKDKDDKPVEETSTKAEDKKDEQANLLASILDSTKNPQPAIPTPGPTPTAQPDESDDTSAGTPLSPQMLGMNQPNSTPAGPMQAPASPATPPVSTPDDSDDSDDNTPSPEVSALFAKNQTDNSSLSAQKAALQNSINGAQGFTDNTVSGLQAAQDQARQDQARNALMKGIGNISGGLIGLGMHAKAPDQDANTKFYDAQDAIAKNLPAEFLARGEQEKNDPNSAISAQAKAFAAPIMQKLGIKMPDNISYSALEKLNPLLVKQADAQDAIQARHEDLALKYQTLAQSKSDAKDQKASKSQDQALTSTQQLLESARGNSAAQAEKDLYASQKADSLYNRYKNPDQMNNAEVQLYATEIAKMASGGVPSIHELQGLNPATIPSQLSAIAQKYSNSPSSANAGAFLQRYKAYSDSLAQDAKNVIQDKYGRVIESRKNILGPENYDALQANYINRFTNGTSAGAKNSAPTASGKVTVSNGQQTYQIDPSDVQHAQADGFKVVQ